jgi:hypothetical protein
MHRRGSERRRFIRVDDEVVASIVRTGSEPGTDTRTLNFSAGGVLLASAEYIEQGTEVRVALHLTDGHEPVLVEFAARVIRVRSRSDHLHEVAVELVGGSAADQRALQDEIARRVGTPPPTPSLPPLTA